MNIPDFNSFDVYHTGISGGKDSTRVVLWLRFESGVSLDKIDITFCDTDNEDPLTYAYIDLIGQLIAPVPITVLQPEKGFWDLAYSRHSFPNRRARFCTPELKIVPTRAYVHELLAAGKNVLMMNGVRRGEGHSSNDRGAAAEWEFDIEGFGTWIYRPIVHETLDQVRAGIARHVPIDRVAQLVRDDPTMQPEIKTLLIEKIVERGIPDNPLYSMGARRVGCFPCIFSVKGEVRAMARYRPERIDYIETQEQHVGSVNPFGYCNFFHANTVPERFRRKHIEGITLRQGLRREYEIPTIRDVVDWSRTARGGAQYDMELDLPPVTACELGGMCE